MKKEKKNNLIIISQQLEPSNTYRLWSGGVFSSYSHIPAVKQPVLPRSVAKLWNQPVSPPMRVYRHSLWPPVLPLSSWYLLQQSKMHPAVIWTRVWTRWVWTGALQDMRASISHPPPVVASLLSWTRLSFTPGQCWGPGKSWSSAPGTSAVQLTTRISEESIL